MTAAAGDVSSLTTCVVRVMVIVIDRGDADDAICGERLPVACFPSRELT